MVFRVIYSLFEINEPLLMSEVGDQEAIMAFFRPLLPDLSLQQTDKVFDMVIIYRFWLIDEG